MNQLRFIRNVLYRMKRRYGLPANLIKIISEVVDLETGVKTLTRDNLQLSRVIILPSTIKREFFYDLAFITGNKDFTYGGSTLADSRKFIIDQEDLGSWVLAVGDGIIYNGKRYEIQEVDEFENKTGYLITAKESESVAINNLIPISIFDELTFGDEVTND